MEEEIYGSPTMLRYVATFSDALLWQRSWEGSVGGGDVWPSLPLLKPVTFGYGSVVRLFSVRARVGDGLEWPVAVPQPLVREAIWRKVPQSHQPYCTNGGQKWPQEVPLPMLIAFLLADDCPAGCKFTRMGWCGLPVKVGLPNP